MPRILRWVGAVALVVAAALVLGTFIPHPLLPAASSDIESKPHRVLVLSNPIHTDIAIPIDARTKDLFGFLRETGMPLDTPNARHLIVGWGGREFYISTPTWSELRPMPLFKGLTLDRAAIHIDIAAEIGEPQPNVLAFNIGDAEYHSLLGYISESFARQNGEPILIPDAHYGVYDRFYEANGYFTAALGCNTWTAEALRRAGLRTGLWNPIPTTLRLSLDLYN